MDEKVRNSDLTDSQRLLSSSSDSDRARYSSIQPSAGANIDIYSERTEAEMSAPTDRYHVVYFVLYILGLGTLLPWNFFITANDYWMYKLRDNATAGPTTAPPTGPPNATLPANESDWVESTSVTYNKLQSLFQSSLSICAMLPNVIMQLVNTMLQQRIDEKIRMLGSMVVTILLFLLTTVLVKVDTSAWQEAFFGVTMASVVLLNCATAIFQSSLFGIAANLPPGYVQPVMAGQGMGGVFASLAMIAALAFSKDATSSAFAYFITAMVVTAVTGLCYLLLGYNEFYSHFCRANQTEADLKNREDLLNCEKVRKCSLKDDETTADDVWIRRQSDDEKDSLGEVAYNAKTVPPVWMILKKIWPHFFSVVFTLFVTLACFPAIIAGVRSTSGDPVWGNIYFTPVTCFLLFNASDWIGRTAAGFLHFPSEHNTVGLLVCVLARGAFPVLFALCNVQPRHTPVVFHNDAYFIVFVLLFGLSNGHLSTLAMQYGPKRVEPELATTAGSMLGWGMSVGLAAGAGFSFVIKMAI